MMNGYSCQDAEGVPVQVEETAEDASTELRTDLACFRFRTKVLNVLFALMLFMAIAVDRGWIEDLGFALLAILILPWFICPSLWFLSLAGVMNRLSWGVPRRFMYLIGAFLAFSGTADHLVDHPEGQRSSLFALLVYVGLLAFLIWSVIRSANRALGEAGGGEE